MRRSPRSSGQTLLNGVEVIPGTRWRIGGRIRGREARKQPFTAIPYYAWANRGPGEMAVWLADREDAVRPLGSPKYPTRRIRPQR